MERKRVLVAFGDICGFTSFTRRAINSPEEKANLIDGLCGEFEKIGKNKRYYVKYTGDGFMALRELPFGDVNQSIVDAFIRDMFTVSRNADNIIKGRYPRPRGFRVRVTSGIAFKRYMIRRCAGKMRKEPEYIDYPVSLADRLLEVYAEKHLCICHESVVQLINRKRNGIQLDRLPAPPKCPRGIDQEDIDGLWSFRFEPPIKKAAPCPGT